VKIAELTGKLPFPYFEKHGRKRKKSRNCVPKMIHAEITACESFKKKY